MARTGMANPILELRALTQTGTADYTVGTVTYWTDDQLQTALDRNREDVFREALEVVATNDGSGTARYYDYYCTPGCYEEGTAAFIVANSLGSAVTATINYQTGHLSFGTVDQKGTAYYLSARRFDLNAAAAEVWRKKAASVAAAYDFSADGQSMSRSQMQKQYLQMAREFEAMAGPMSVQMVRGDANA